MAASRGRSPLVAALALACTLGVAGEAGAADPYFKGRTVNLLVAFAAGGPVDLSARLFANYFRNHIPGEPNVVVQNRPGAGGSTAANYVFEVAKGDGETLLFGPWFPVSQLLGQEGIRFKYEEFALVAAFSTAGYLLYTRPDVVPGGLKSPADIVKAPNLKFAGQNPFNTFDLLGRLTIELFDVRYNYVTGYRGSADIRTAIMKNESNIGVESATAYRSVLEPTMVKPGTVVPLWAPPAKDASGKYVRLAALPEIPTVVEVYRQAFGKDPSGAKWETLDVVLGLLSTMGYAFVGPPSLKGEPLEVLRKAAYATLTDKEHVADQEKRFGSAFNPVGLDQAQGIMKSLGAIKPEILANLKSHVAAGAQVRQ
jgi:tripartite-type tricarboxylate transporter receptor subunit TctC